MKKLTLILGNQLFSYHEIQKLEKAIDDKSIIQLHCFEIEDKFFEERLIHLCHKKKIELVVHPSPMFMASRENFQDYLSSVKRPFMKTFYERQRKKFSILIDSSGSPEGGSWSYDQDNRKKWPKNHTPPPLPRINKNKNDQDFIKLVDKFFKDHPGDGANFWLATTRQNTLVRKPEFNKLLHPLYRCRFSTPLLDFHFLFVSGAA